MSSLAIILLRRLPTASAQSDSLNSKKTEETLSQSSPEQELIQGEEEDSLFEHFRVVVDRGQSPLRIDKFLFNRIESVSRNKIQQAADDLMVLVNGIPVKSNYKVRPLDEITLMLPEPKIDYNLLAENISLNIQYEDDDVIISGTIYRSDGKTLAPNIILYVYHTDANSYYSPSDTQTVGKRHGHFAGMDENEPEG